MDNKSALQQAVTAVQQPQQQVAQPVAQTQPSQPIRQPQAPQQSGLSSDILLQLLQNPQLLIQLIHMGVFTMVNGQLALAGMQDANKAPSPQSDNLLTDTSIPSSQKIKGSPEKILQQLQKTSSGDSNPGYGAENASALASMSNSLALGGVNTAS